MTPIDIRNFVIALIGLFAVAPVIGILIAGNRRGQQAVFFIIIFIQFAKSTSYGLMFFSIEWYRGHTKGVEFTLIDILCVSLLIAMILNQPGKFKFCPPGLLFYLFFVFAATLSILDTYKPHYTLMATANHLKAALLFITAFNFIKTRDDFRVILWAMACALMIESAWVLKQKYVDGFFQPYGFYDHQNSMCMWAYFYAVPLFAASLSKETKPLDAWFWLAGVGAGGLAIVAALSRGSLAALIFSCLAVLTLSIIFGGFTRRKIAIIAIGLFAGTAVLYKASDSIIERFTDANDVGSETKDFRVLLNEVSKQMLLDTKTGVGWNNFNIANSRPYPRYSQMYEAFFANVGHSIDIRQYRSNANTESLYWMYLAETGFLGFGALLLLMIVHLLRLVRIYWERDREAKDSTVGFFILGMIIVSFVLYFHSTVERILTQTNNLWAWLIYLGFASYFEQQRRERLKPQKHARWQLYMRLFRKFVLKEKDPLTVSTKATSHG